MDTGPVGDLFDEEIVLEPDLAQAGAQLFEDFLISS